MSSIVIYTKADCSECVEAKSFAKIHNVNLDIREVHSMYEVFKRHDDIPLEITNVNSFPIFYYDESLKNFEEFKKECGEPMLLDNPNRHVLFPIMYEDLWNMYEKAVASFWTVNEIDFSRDEDDYENRMKPEEQYFINHILGFFASSDGIVNENLARNFSDEVQIPEARAFYSYQQYNETIHSHNYSLMIDRYVKDHAERAKLFDGIHTIPAIAKKATWASKWIEKSACPMFALRLIAFACVEGIMFSGSFCAIFWLKKRGLMPGLSFSNELISRDEGMHQDFAVMMFNKLKNKPSEQMVHNIVQEAVEHEQEFIQSAISCAMVGMNVKLMGQYIEYVADRLLQQLHYSPLYNAQNPFDFMENICLSGKTNFFERRVGEYAKSGMLVNEENQTFAIDDDF